MTTYLTRKPAVYRFETIWGWSICLFLCLFGRTPLVHADQAAVAERAPPAAAKVAENAKSIRYWTSNWSFDEIDVKKLNSRLERIGLSVPIDLQGDVTVRFEVSVPLNALTDAKKYRIDGIIKANRLRIEELVLEKFHANIKLDDGMMQIDHFNGRMIDATDRSQIGSVGGDAVVQLSPLQDLAVNLETAAVPIKPLYELVNTFSKHSDSKPLAGTASGQIQFVAPLKKVGEIASWNATANLQINGLVRGDSIPLNIRTGELSIREGVLTAQRFEVFSPEVDALSASASAVVELAAEQNFRIVARSNDLPLSVVAELAGFPPRSFARSFAQGMIDVDVEAEGKLAAFEWDMKGRIASPDLRISGFELGLVEHSFKFDEKRIEFQPLQQRSSDLPQQTSAHAMILKQVRANYEISDDRFTLSDLTLDVFQGRVTGSATILKDNVLHDQAAANQLNLAWSNVSPVFHTDTLFPVDVLLSLKTSGKLDWEIPAGQWRYPAQQAGTATIELESIKLGEEEIGRLTTTLKNDGKNIELSATGSLFGGTVSVETNSPLEANPKITWPEVIRNPNVIRFSSEPLQLDRLISLVPDSRLPSSRFRQLRGRMTVTGAIETPNKISAKVRLDQLGMGSITLSRRIDASVRFHDQVLHIDKLAGNFADGRIDVVGDWDFQTDAGPLGQGNLNVRVASVNASQAVDWVSDTIAKHVGGSLSGNLHLLGAEPLRVRGSAQTSDALLAGVVLNGVNSSVLGSYSPRSGRWNVAFPNLVGTTARGRLRGDAKFSSTTRGGGFDLHSNWSFERVDFGQMVAQASGKRSSTARGQIGGSLILEGKGIQGLADLIGSFETELDGSQAVAIPGLAEAQRFLGALPLAGTRIEQGRMNGTIAGGRARIKEFVLHSPPLKVMANGSVGLADQRMDIAAVISTGNFQANRLADAYLQAVALDYVSPLAILIRINRLLNNRTIYVDVVGKLSAPSLRLKPLSTLRDETIRYLLREIIGINSIGLTSSDSGDMPPVKS